VMFREVGAADRWGPAEGGVASMMVVPVEPAGKGLRACYL